MRIKMKQTMSGSDVDASGVTVGPNTYLTGHEYEVGPELAKAFCVHLKAAEYVVEVAEKSVEELEAEARAAAEGEAGRNASESQGSPKEEFDTLPSQEAPIEESLWKHKEDELIEMIQARKISSLSKSKLKKMKKVELVRMLEGN